MAIGIALALHSTTPENLKISVIEKPLAVAAPAQPVLRATTQPKPKPKTTVRPVFGLSRQSITSPNGIEVKAGNTVAKTPDDLKLRPEDEGAVPEPVDEFLVSQMPVLANEYRIPYPPEAKKKGVQGSVVMDIIVDEKGVVRDAKLVSGPGEGLNEAALEAVKKFKFSPALAQR